MKPNILEMNEYTLSCMNGEILKYNFSIPELEKIVQCSGISLKAIIRTQKLTKSFCQDYLLSGEYTLLDSDSNLDEEYIQKFQHVFIKN